ncbi:capsular exopolysaccharide family [Mariniphaga anaerophila]|uniref:non-specific protein-tyrosine kinase n=1 Tax=Mariniphaga anaerophila TaxID=1484053 RepID=A0A1M5BN78_9BACT|nr:tyrosine-protein kinase [Mariniphaga anaerophila]SHF43677.1 capsular exopolysaccharide family [Mariniphaga anaerophila]
MEKIDDIIKLIDSKEEEKNQNLLLKYLKHWPWFLALCLLGAFVGYFIFRNSPSAYEVTSRLLVKNEETELSSVQAFNSPRPDARGSSNIEKQIGILQSYSLYKKALANLNWDYSWYQKRLLYYKDLYNNDPFELVIPPNAINAKGGVIEVIMLNDSEYNIQVTGETYLNGYAQEINIDKNLKFGEPFTNEFYNFTLNRKNAVVDETYMLLFNNLDAQTANYMGKTQIFTEQENSNIITISITGNALQKEADFINELTDVFIEFGMEARSSRSKSSEDFINEQLERLKNSLTTSEEKFSDYRRNNQVMNLGQEAQSVYSRLEEIEQEQYLTQLQLDYYKNLQQYIDDANKIEEMVNPSVVGITDSNLSGMLSKLMELYSRREVLSYTVQEKNPAILILEKEIKVVRDGLEESLKSQLIATESKMNSLQQRYLEIQARLRRLPETEKNLISIQREFELNNEIYTYMLQKKTEASISTASIVPEIQVIDPAIVEASRKTGPNLILNLAIGIAGGGILPFILITFLIIFNNKIETITEVEKGSRIPVLEGIMKHKYKSTLPVIQHPRSGIAESFRGLKTNINTLIEGTGSKVISINSLVPGEGKSFISANLAAVLSKTNKKVLLIGADLHKPTLHEFLKVKESIGLRDFLAGEKNIDEIITSTSIPNLNFVQTGTAIENPSDLLDGSKFEKLIDYTRSLFDYIIIDNAPLLLIPDAILTSQFSDISLFVLRIGYSHKAQIKQINKAVDFNRIERSAIVLNDTPESGYGYGYGYRKKYWKKGYGEYKIPKSSV